MAQWIRPANIPAGINPCVEHGYNYIFVSTCCCSTISTINIKCSKCNLDTVMFKSIKTIDKSVILQSELFKLAKMEWNRLNPKHKQIAHANPI